MGLGSLHSCPDRSEPQPLKLIVFVFSQREARSRQGWRSHRRRPRALPLSSRLYRPRSHQTAAPGRISLLLSGRKSRKQPGDRAVPASGAGPSPVPWRPATCHSLANLITSRSQLHRKLGHGAAWHKIQVLWWEADAEPPPVRVPEDSGTCWAAPLGHFTAGSPSPPPRGAEQGLPLLLPGLWPHKAQDAYPERLGLWQEGTDRGSSLGSQGKGRVLCPGARAPMVFPDCPSVPRRIKGEHGWAQPKGRKPGPNNRH